MDNETANALKWAREQNFQSVSARYAKLIVQNRDALADRVLAAEARLAEAERERDEWHARAIALFWKGDADGATCGHIRAATATIKQLLATDSAPDVCKCPEPRRYDFEGPVRCLRCGKPPGASGSAPAAPCSRCKGKGTVKEYDRSPQGRSDFSITVPCPACSASVDCPSCAWSRTKGRTECPHCGATLTVGLANEP